MMRYSLLVVLSVSLLFGQACPQLGLNTVEEAENQFYNNRKNETKRLLDKAYSQCRRDGPVVRRIAEAYRLIGETGEADHYTRLADDLGALPEMRLTQPSDARVLPPSIVRHKFALVVGVSKFKDFSSVNQSLKSDEPIYQRIPDLQFAAKDAQDFASALLSPSVGRFDRDRVEVILDQKVTADRVRRAIAKIEQNANEDDLVVLFFSSHGSSPEMDPAASNARSGFILMHDTEYRNVLDTSTAYPMYELASAIQRFRAKRVIAFLDTCYSGDTVNAKGSRAFGGNQPGSKGVMVSLSPADEMVMKAVPQDRARVVITSSGANERSWESSTPEGGNGYFTKYLIEAMAKENGEPSISQIYRYLDSTVPSAVATEKNGAPQHPQFRSYPNQEREFNVIIGAPETEGANKR